MTANTKSICDDALYPSHLLSTAQNLDTVQTDVREHLAHLSSDVTMPIPCMGEKGITLTVIFLVDLPEVSKKHLDIGRLLEFVQSHHRHVHHTILLCALLCGGMKDKNVTLLPNSHDVILFAHLYVAVLPAK